MNKMRDDQDFNINFVKIIENERSLYDKSLPEYRSKEEHERIWQKISTEVNESGKFYWKSFFTIRFYSIARELTIAVIVWCCNSI